MTNRKKGYRIVDKIRDTEGHKMVDWNKWKSTGKYFNELIYLHKYVKEHGIKEFDYDFTFSYGYHLLVRR